MLLKEIKSLKEYSIPGNVDTSKSARNNPARADTKGEDYTKGIKKTLTKDQDEKLKGDISKKPPETQRWDIKYEKERGVDRIQDELSVENVKKESVEASHEFTKGQKVKYKGKTYVVEVPDAKGNLVGIVPEGGGKTDLVKQSEVSVIKTAKPKAREENEEAKMDMKSKNSCGGHCDEKTSSKAKTKK